MAQLSLHSLRGKQSVRVTFKLAPDTIDLLSVMASQLGIKQKTLFDHLIERQELRHHLDQKKTSKKEEKKDVSRKQKTFVLSQETLETLNILAEKYHAPRNFLVELAVRRLLPVLLEEREKHEKRKIILKEMTKDIHRSYHLLEEAERLLEPDDPVCNQLRDANKSLEQAYRNTVSIIERGKGMENL